MLNKYEIEIPKQVVRALGLLDKDVGNTIKKELAVYFFQRNMLSLFSFMKLFTLLYSSTTAPINIPTG